jgi:hypothetical protein
MQDEHTLALRQVDQPRYDFAAISDDLDFPQVSARADSDAEGTGARGARDHLRRGGARDLDRIVLARLPVIKATAAAHY